MAQLVGSLSYTPKACQLDSLSGHIPRLWVRFPVREHMGGNRTMFLSHTDVSLSLSLSPSLPPSLPSSSSLKISQHILGWGLKKIHQWLWKCHGWWNLHVLDRRIRICQGKDSGLSNKWQWYISVDTGSACISPWITVRDCPRFQPLLDVEVARNKSLLF